MHPSQASEFVWDNGNESELARHGIRPEEVEEVFDNHPTWAINKRERSGQWLMIGQTHGGRFLTVAIATTNDPWFIRPVTGWDSTPPERRLHQ
jgi:uncharacterized DUF497 family protein